MIGLAGTGLIKTRGQLILQPGQAVLMVSLLSEIYTSLRSGSLQLCLVVPQLQT